MAMKERMRLIVNARQLAEMITEAIDGRIQLDGEEAVAIDIPADLTITIVIRKKRPPRVREKSARLAVASAGPLSEAEQRYA